MPRRINAVDESRLCYAPPKGAKSNPNRKPMPFKQSEVERAVKGVQARKLPISAVEVDPHTGVIKISIGAPPSGSGNNPWDEVLTK